MIVWRRSSALSRRPLLVLANQRGFSKLQANALPTRIADLLETPPSASAASIVTVNGFVRTIRKQKRIAFATVGDGSSVEPLQALLSPEQAERLSTGSAVAIRGRWTRSPGDKKQAYELHADEVNLQGDNDSTTYPIQKKYHTPEYLRTLPHLRVRTTHNALLLRFRSQIIADTTQFFSQKGFVQTHTPVITSSDCEGAGEVFTVHANHPKTTGEHGQGLREHDPEPFFGSPKYLTVSSQLHLEALAQSVGRVWTLSPTFRAEKSDTARHLSEFYMLEAELAFVNKLDEVMDVVEALLRYLAGRLAKSKIGQELLLVQDPGSEESGTARTKLSARWNSLLERPWQRMTYHQAVSRLKEAESRGQMAFDISPDDTKGLQTEHERYIAEELCAGPVFVTDYPKSIKPFYMAPSDKPSSDVRTTPTVSCFDLLLPEVCEVVGGSMREHRLGPLETAMRQQGLIRSNSSTKQQPGGDKDSNSSQTGHGDGRSNMDWYLDLRRYGSVPHGGFGLGFDRLLGFLSGTSNVRDVVTFPRYYKRCLS